MRYALVSDIHSNLQAWHAVLEDIRLLRIDHIINLGDIVGYGPNPKEVLNSVCKHCAASVIGNHDAVCAGLIDSSSFNDSAKEVIEWTKQQLDDTDCRFIKQIPEKLRPKETNFLATHAEVISPLNFGYILTEEDAENNFAACDDPLIFIGHTHQPGIFIENSSGKISIQAPKSFICDPKLRYIVNPGSVGDPRTVDITASYCVYDSNTHEIEFRRIPFDIDAYRRAIDATRLTARPFFIRHLDAAIPTRGTMITPSVIETDTAPKINLNPKIPVVRKKQKRNPLIATSVIMLLAAGTLWIFVFLATKQNQDEETTATITTQPTDPILPEENSHMVNHLSIPSDGDQLPVTARYIKICNSGGKPLVFAELEAFSGGINVAKRKTATQSSTRYKSSVASNAVDGNRDGRTNDNLARTATEKTVWWKVDLGQEYEINSIKIWNREATLATMKQLDGFYVILLNENHQSVYRNTQKVGQDRVIEFR